MTAIDPTAAPAQPATPGQALRWAAGRGDHHVDPADLRRWADELDAAPAVYALPAEPPAGTQLWDRHGCPWARIGDRWVIAAPDDGATGIFREARWVELLGWHGPLSTAPPAGAGAQ